MLSKEEYIELYVKGGQAINAILEVLNNLVEVKVEIDGEEAIKIIRDFNKKYFDLINEHFEPKENTSEFKHFKLHSDSTLKNQTKKELIDYIKMLYHNWGVTDEQLKRIIDKAKELSDSNDELRGQLYFCEPYKFEDLKPNMWVYDGIEKLICQIGLISKNAIHREYVDGTISDSPFEENRFFPVQCANYLGGI
ncbi:MULTISPECIES: hypothetical protein [Thomasclavelia]|uniref:hypothetical protein n=1 Tax=Thomasclavelia TaxID=3025755 RepID=UPI001C388689|nr:MULTISPECIES: hypothetical protein [Thomasclavelia]MBV3128410.1 hypothetical protein [Thomasclavelia ramosa]MBV3132196.1 hypothetical protein [Thomasclavelia ramosa]MBV3141242.1 hypothetical protein [Thomasclavelia ramosa]MBV3143894.1 hypothetical protein [Thomasclavelia ramosa]MBV3152462.1 hypothetical protein [Thomasclavelia ramosa]